MFKTNREVIDLQSFYTRCKTDVSPDAFALRLRHNARKRSHFILATARISNVSARGKYAKQAMWSYFTFVCLYLGNSFYIGFATLPVSPAGIVQSCRAGWTSALCRELQRLSAAAAAAAADRRLLFTGRLRNNSRPSASGQAAGETAVNCLRFQILEICSNQTRENFKGALVRKSGFIFLNIFFPKIGFMTK